MFSYPNLFIPFLKLQFLSFAFSSSILSFMISILSLFNLDQ